MKWKNFFPPCLKQRIYLLKNVSANSFCPVLVRFHRSLFKVLKNASPRLDIIVTAGRIYDLMQICTACIASSGTATLETALMGLPTVLVYRLSAITWFLAKHLVRVEYAGLPNILLHKEVTPELLQDKVTAGNIAEVVLPWLTNEVKRQENIRELKSVRAVLGEGGAVRRTAELILRTAEGK